MAEEHLTALFLSQAEEYIASLSDSEQGTMAAHVELMKSGDFDSADTKQLRGQVRELITGHHRLTYFRIEDVLYFVRGFRKKSRKTPKNEIDYAEKIYKSLQQK